jgi:heme-degrading monooxygenase HmoA
MKGSRTLQRVLYKQSMAFVSITRLRIRSIRFLPFFAVYSQRSIRQVRRADGFQGGSMLADKSWTFWTMTTWDSRERMRAYMTDGAHRSAMPHLLDWCDEASVVHWDRLEEGLPTWAEADRRMRENGRVSKVLHPSPNHADMSYREPRVTTGGPITPAR